MFRQATAFAMLALGGWLSYGALDAVLLIVDRGSSLSDALFAPPTGAIRIVGAALMTFGGLLAVLSRRGGAMVSGAGALIILALSGLIAAAGADPSLWMNTFLYGIAAILLAVLMLSLRRQ